MSQDVNGNRKLFWKEVSKVNGGKVESCSRAKDGKRRLALSEVEVRRIWKKYYKELYNVDTQEEVPVHVCGFTGVWRGNYFGGKPIRKTEVEERVMKIKNGKTACNDEITGEMIPGGGDKMVDGIWRICNMAFDTGY